MLTFILPAVVVLGIGFFNNRMPDSGRTYYIVNNDSGIYGKEFVKVLSKDFNLKVYSKEQAIEKLKKKTIAEFYEIGSSFSEKLENGQKPQLIVNRRETTQGFSDFQMKVDELMNRLLFSAVVKDRSGEDISIDELSTDKVDIKVASTKNTGIGSQIAINMLISFNLFCAIGMCYELFALRSERTLKRSLTTGNRPSMIIGGIFGAQFIMVMIGYIALLFAYTFLNDRTLLAQTPIIILNLMMTTAVALSLAVCVVRVIKDEKLIGIVMQIILVGTCFVGGSFVPVEMLPKSITFLSKITPQYWAIQSIKEGNIGFSLIVLLFAILLFTAGTISTKSFAE
jgi:ABC-2 type transport system permease protein